MSSDAQVEAINASDTRVRPTVLQVVTSIVGAVLGAVIVAFLVAGGYWYLVLGLLLVLPAFVLLNRHPLVAITVWLLLDPLVTVTDSGSIRSVFWLIHRALPVVTLVVIILGGVAGIRTRKLARLGWPELMMAGYVAVTLVSIAYTSLEPAAVGVLLYDRVIAPMCLYLVIRLLEPDEGDLRWFVPAVMFVLLSQALIGLLQWTASGAIPSEWQIPGRTTGSFHDPGAYTTTMLFCGLFVLHRGLSSNGRALSRAAAVGLFALAMLMVFLTFSRGGWLAGLVALAGALWVFRRSAGWLVAIVVPAVVLLLAAGVLSQQVRFAEERLTSAEAEESALSRLPVVYASLSMFGSEPVTGWGYENFDRYSRPFQRRVGNLVYPEKDHASHNLYLTLLAEQGLLGFVLFLGPVAYWLIRTRSSARHMPSAARKLVAILWIVLASHVVVNSFAVMKVPFGKGMWWLTLGLIASLVHRFRQPQAMALGDPTPSERSQTAVSPAKVGT